MLVVELVGGTLALLMEMLVGVILAQPLKATSGEKTTRPGFHKVIASRKLHCLTGPIYLRVSAPAERPRDVEVEASGPRLAYARVQRSEGQRSPESESGGPGSAGSGPELEDK